MYKKIIFVFCTMVSFAYGAAAKESFPKLTNEYKLKILNEAYETLMARHYLNAMYDFNSSVEAVEKNCVGIADQLFDSVLSSVYRDEYSYACQEQGADIVAYRLDDVNVAEAITYIKENISHFVRIFFKVKDIVQGYRGNDILGYVTSGLEAAKKPTALVFKGDNKEIFERFVKEVYSFITEKIDEDSRARAAGYVGAQAAAGAGAQESFPAVTDAYKDLMVEEAMECFKKSEFLDHLYNSSPDKIKERIERAREHLAVGLFYLIYPMRSGYKYDGPNAKCALKFMQDNFENCMLIFFEVKALSEAWHGDGFLKFLLEGVKIKDQYIRLMFHDVQKGKDFIQSVVEFLEEKKRASGAENAACSSAGDVEPEPEPELDQDADAQDGAEAAAGAGAGNAHNDKKDVKDQS